MKKLFLLSTLTLLAAGQLFASEGNNTNPDTEHDTIKIVNNNEKSTDDENPEEKTSFFESLGANTRNYAYGKKDRFSNAWKNGEYITLTGLTTSHTIGLPFQLGYDASSALKKSDSNVILKGLGIIAFLLLAAEGQFEILRRLYNRTNFEFGKEYTESPVHTHFADFCKGIKEKYTN